MRDISKQRPEGNQYLPQSAARSNGYLALQIRAYYSCLEHEPIPQHLHDLLQLLDKAEKVTGSKASG